uniref:Homeobox domain-containing protein n=1 Tax=Schistosoma mansoni TaxID=6183 RepID=A0A3Q0KUV9_SCHMA
MNTPSRIHLKNDNHLLNSYYISTKNSLIHSDQIIVDCYMKQNLQSNYTHNFYNSYEYNNNNNYKKYFNISDHSLEHLNSLSSMVKNVMINVPNKNLCILTKNYDNQSKNNIDYWKINYNYNLKDIYNKTDSIYNYTTTTTTTTTTTITDHVGQYRRKSRKPYSRNQIMILEKEYAIMPYITRQRRWEISNKLQLSERQIKVWFQNRRMKTKKLKTLLYSNNERTLQQNDDNSKINIHEQQYSTLFDKQKLIKTTNQWNNNISTNSVTSCILDYNSFVNIT